MREPAAGETARESALTIPEKPWEMVASTSADFDALSATPPPWAPEPPAVPKDVLESSWPALAQNESPAKQAAVRWWLAGYSWREAAGLAGYSNHNRLREVVFKYNLQKYQYRTDRIIHGHRVIADRCQEVMMKRLDDPESEEAIDFRDLTIAAGVSTDKLRDFEGWAKNLNRESGVISAFEALAAAITNGKVSLELRVTPADQAIDVTPEPVLSGDLLPDPPPLKPWERERG